jgi:hypothetical protein
VVFKPLASADAARKTNQEILICAAGIVRFGAWRSPSASSSAAPEIISPSQSAALF